MLLYGDPAARLERVLPTCESIDDGDNGLRGQPVQGQPDTRVVIRKWEALDVLVQSLPELESGLVLDFQVLRNSRRSERVRAAAADAEEHRTQRSARPIELDLRGSAALWPLVVRPCGRCLPVGMHEL